MDISLGKYNQNFLNFLEIPIVCTIFIETFQLIVYEFELKMTTFATRAAIATTNRICHLVNISFNCLNETMKLSDIKLIFFLQNNFFPLTRRVHYLEQD